MLDKSCKSCNVKLDDVNSVTIKTRNKGRLYTYIRSICKSCRSKQVMEGNKNNPKRKAYMNARARKLGIVKQYPCETCSLLCYKKYAKAFCSVMCRFLSYVEKKADCWVWVGASNKRGYGKFALDKNNIYMAAHRAAYVLFNNVEPNTLMVCHSCDNPSCVNPDHLWLGTAKDNIQDSINKGRQSWQKVKLIQ